MHHDTESTRFVTIVCEEDTSFTLSVVIGDNPRPWVVDLVEFKAVETSSEPLVEARGCFGSLFELTF